MEFKYLKSIAVLILILSTLFFLWNSFLLFLAGFVREHNAIEINDDNREKIVCLLEENIACYEEIPDINQAVKIEYLVLMHKDEITVHYEDKTTYNFFIKDAYKNPFTLYIKNKGYNVYFNSSEFTVDLIKVVIPFTMSIVSVVFLLMVRKNK